MEEGRRIDGFSKLSKNEKIDWLIDTFLDGNSTHRDVITSYWYCDEDKQRVFEGFSENTITNFHLPFGIAPNLLIDGRYYAVPMVIEESSVVAAASSAAKYWSKRGGFKTEILGTVKLGQVSFTWTGDFIRLQANFQQLKQALLDATQDITANMTKRGGGILDIELVDLSAELDHTYQLKASFETCDSMGANFINTCLEEFAQTLDSFLTENVDIYGVGDLEIVMSILSNYTTDCLVKAWVECPVQDLKVRVGEDVVGIAQKFKRAVDIARVDTYRAVTHNKGIFNGIDAVVLATGNDFRAIEASGHAYAAISGKYRSLSQCTIDDGIFKFEITVPMALGTVGGLTQLHPLADLSLKILGNPTAQELMRIVAATGLAQNFAAVKSLTTTGIQHGHMKMHLQNILNQLEATQEENAYIVNHLMGDVVSYTKVRSLLSECRQS